MYKQRLARLLIIACFTGWFVSFQMPSQAAACSCAVQKDAHEAAARSQAVFKGKVIDIEQKGGIIRSLLRKQARTDAIFEVQQSWKGVFSSVVTISSDWSTCGFDFVEGEDYLVYAYLNDERDLYTSICSRTGLVRMRDDDLKQLGVGAAPSDSPTAGETWFWAWIVGAGIAVVLFGYWLYVRSRLGPLNHRRGE